VIIGTAGHVDHGKTELIRALTGIDTDRLGEEKERGISIDLGFAPLRLLDGRLAGVIDVPGHEKFIHNMLAGIGGIDLVILVIDATEGVMPQTKEHLDILELLQIKKGLVAITKIDLVEQEWLEMVEEEVRENLAGTFLADAPLHFVSSVSGKGIGELKEAISKLAATIIPKEKDAPLRIPIDRVFTIAGFGTVLTGTLLSGVVKVGQLVELLPPGKKFRVRGIQVHGQSQEEAFAGQRVALNLANLGKKEVERGSVVASPGYFHLTRYCDARLKLLPGASKPLTNMSPVHFYLGTARVVGRIQLLDAEELKPGEEGFVQCRLDSPLVAKRGDFFIVRSYSPMVTIGGGKILDERPQRHKRFRKDVLRKMEEMNKEDPLPFILEKLKSSQGATLQELSQLTKMGVRTLAELLEQPLAKKKVLLIGEIYVTADLWEEWQNTILKTLELFHEKNSLLPGMQRAQLGGALPRKVQGRVFDALLESLKKDNKLFDFKGELIHLKGFTPKPTKPQQEKLEQIIKAFKQGGLNPPSLKELRSSFGLKKEEDSLLDYLTHSGILVKITEEMYLDREIYQGCLEKLREYFRENRSITLAQYRDLLQSSRRHVQALLEHFDSCKFTRRVGDERMQWKMPPKED
jgi:selenocysteine-specific elongation factor